MTLHTKTTRKIVMDWTNNDLKYEDWLNEYKKEYVSVEDLNKAIDRLRCKTDETDDEGDKQFFDYYEIKEMIDECFKLEGDDVIGK